jgi:hypothetical protein
MRRYTAGLPLLLFALTASADVIFPAFTAPYVSALVFPVALVAILASEGAVYKLAWRHLSTGVVALLVVGANLVSSIAGFGIALLLPDGLVIDPRIHVVQPGPDFYRYAGLGFVLAYILSICIEGGVLKLASHKYSLSRPFRVSLLANTASYILLAGIVWWQL